MKLSEMITDCPTDKVRPQDLREWAAEAVKMEIELASLRAFKQGVDEALNSGDGVYRP